MAKFSTRIRRIRRQIDRQVPWYLDSLESMIGIAARRGLGPQSAMRDIEAALFGLRTLVQVHVEEIDEAVRAGARWVQDPVEVETFRRDLAEIEGTVVRGLEECGEFRRRLGLPPGPASLDEAAAAVLGETVEEMHARIRADRERRELLARPRAKLEADG